jgi:hypothetical protein
MPYRRGSFTLTPPTWPIFAIACVLTILAAIVHYKVVAIGALSAHSFEMLLVAAVLLIAGALFRGI